MNPCALRLRGWCRGVAPTSAPPPDMVTTSTSLVESRKVLMDAMEKKSSDMGTSSPRTRLTRSSCDRSSGSERTAAMRERSEASSCATELPAEGGSSADAASAPVARGRVAWDLRVDELGRRDVKAAAAAEAEQEGERVEEAEQEGERVEEAEQEGERVEEADSAGWMRPWRVDDADTVSLVQRGAGCEPRVFRSTALAHGGGGNARAVEDMAVRDEDVCLRYPRVATRLLAAPHTPCAAPSRAAT
jgi:hypothetical protein